MDRKLVLVAAAIALVLVGAVGGYIGSGYADGDSTLETRGPGGGFAQLTDAERRQMQTMTAEERAAFFKEKGIELPDGAAGMPGADAPAGMRGSRMGLLAGKVAAMDAETITIELGAGGSQKVYLDDDTVRAAEDGAATLAVGSQVMVSATPEADGVNAAQLVVVRK